MSAFTNHAEELLLTWLFTTSTATRPTAWYVALHTDDPGEAGSANEVDTEDDDYARQSITFDDPVADSGKVLSDLQASWTAASDADDYTITHISIWDAATSGNCLMKGPLVISWDQTADGIFTLDVGKVIAALD